MMLVLSCLDPCDDLNASKQQRDKIKKLSANKDQIVTCTKSLGIFL